jgi:uncharacterized membrane protein YqaE (UPF0057 family)
MLLSSEQSVVLQMRCNVDNTKQIVLSIVSFFLPPAGALLADKGGVLQCLLNVLLTIFGVWVFGFLHALWLIWSGEKPPTQTVVIQQFTQPQQWPGQPQPPNKT